MNVQAPLSEIMSTYLLKVYEYDTVEEVSNIFAENDIHHIPVVNKDEELVGIISKMDFVKISFGMTMFSQPNKESYNKALYKTVLVKEVMTDMVVSLSPTDTVEYAFSIFRENLFHAIPITQHKKLVGIVTTFDLLVFAFRPEHYRSIEQKGYINTISD